MTITGNDYHPSWRGEAWLRPYSGEFWEAVDDLVREACREGLPPHCDLHCLESRLVKGRYFRSPFPDVALPHLLKVSRQLADLARGFDSFTHYLTLSDEAREAEQVLFSLDRERQKHRVQEPEMVRVWASALFWIIKQEEPLLGLILNAEDPLPAIEAHLALEALEAPLAPSRSRRLLRHA